MVPPGSHICIRMSSASTPPKIRKNSDVTM
jgi:hypothetical protein